jgi:hypothetical protein
VKVLAACQKRKTEGGPQCFLARSGASIGDCASIRINTVFVPR